LSRTIKGRVWKFGDNINTDLILPGKYLDLGAEEVGGYAMSGVDKDFAKKVNPGDIIVAGKNFGGGSSRETAPWAIKNCGIAAVVAKSFSRIFFRNAINIGLPVIEFSQTTNIADGDEIEIEITKGTIKYKDTIYQGSSIPEEIMEIVQAGGLVQYLKGRLSAGNF